jgi:hypothetical protein
VTDSSVDVGVSTAEVGGGRTVVKVSTDFVEVRMLVVAALDEVLLVGIGASPDAPGQSRSTRLPASTCPRTDVAGAFTLLQTDSMFSSTSSRPLTHSAEHVLPRTKSLTVQPGISLLYARMQLIGTADEPMT